MENPVLIVVLKDNLATQDVVMEIDSIRRLPGVKVVKTIENIVASVLPEVEGGEDDDERPIPEELTRLEHEAKRVLQEEKIQPVIDCACKAELLPSMQVIPSGVPHRFRLIGIAFPCRECDETNMLWRARGFTEKGYTIKSEGVKSTPV